MSASLNIPMQERHLADGVLGHEFRADGHPGPVLATVKQPSLSGREMFKSSLLRRGAVQVNGGVVHDRYVEGISLRLGIAIKLFLRVQTFYSTAVDPVFANSYRAGGALLEVAFAWLPINLAQPDPTDSEVPAQKIQHIHFATFRPPLTEAETAESVDGWYIAYSTSGHVAYSPLGF